MFLHMCAIFYIKKNTSLEFIIECHDLGVTIDEIWTGEWIYLPLVHTTQKAWKYM
jgi:hypothetical protein